jgi:hypothetical protein
MKILTFFAVAAFLSLAGTAKAQIIAVNFSHDNNGFDNNVISATTGNVPVAASGWNNVSLTPGDSTPVTTNYDGSSIKDSSGLTIPDFSISAAYNDNYQSQTGAFGNLLYAYVDNLQGNMAISGVSYASYDVYVYVTSDTNARKDTVTIDAGTAAAETLGFTTYQAYGDQPGGLTVNSDPNAIYPDVTTLEFENVTGTSFDLSKSDVSGGTGIAGFEIVAVPEPSTYAMMGLGLLALMAARRFRQLSA